jgi:hypothetical protein
MAARRTFDATFSSEKGGLKKVASATGEDYIRFQ